MSSEVLDLATKREQEQRLEKLRRSEFYLAEAAACARGELVLHVRRSARILVRRAF